MSTTTTTIFQAGSYTSLTDAFTLVLDLNDRATYYLDTLDLAQPEKADTRVFNIRTPGEIVERVQYKNRKITATLLIRAASATALIAACRSLIAAVEHPPYTLRIQLPNGSLYSYADVVRVTHNIPFDAKAFLAGAVGAAGKKRVNLLFECSPGLRGDRVVLSNAVSNPGFEAPSGPAVQVFNDPLTNLNAYVNRTMLATVLADNPVRYYPMDEMSGTVATDAGSSGVNGTYTNATIKQTGATGATLDYAVQFSGSTSYLSSAATGLPSGTSAWSMDLWVNLAATPTGSTLVVATFGGSGSNNNAQIGFNTTGNPFGAVAGNTAVTAGSTLSNGAWHHLCVTFAGGNGGTLTFYVDGVSQGTTTIATPTIGTTGFNLATNIGISTFVACTLDDAAVYSTALSGARVTQHFQAVVAALAQDTFYFSDAVTALQGAAGASSTTLAVLRYYRLDETSGTTAYDASGNLQNGTTHGSPTQGVTGGLTGDSDTAYTFASGSSQYISSPTTGLPTGNAAMSMACLFKFAANPASNKVLIGFGANTTAHAGFNLYINTSGKLALNNGSAGTTITAAAASTTAAWHLAVATWDGTTMSLYVDNAAAVTATPGNQAIGASPALTIGADTAPSTYYDGQIDEVLFLTGCLTSAQMTALYNAFHVAPATTANTLLIPAGGRVAFGSPAWGAMNLWQGRFRYLAGGTFTFYLHYTNQYNYLAAVVSGTALTLNHVVTGTTHQLGTQALQLVNGVQYWLQVTQFPPVPGAAPKLQTGLFADSGGTVGAAVAALVGPVAAFDGVTAQTGQPQIACGGTALGIGGNFAKVLYVGLFGPGGWFVSGLINTANSQAAGSWEQTMANCYAAGPVQSTGAARLDFPAGGTVDCVWETGVGTPVTGSSAIPVQTAGNTLAASAKVRAAGLSGSSNVALVVLEYDVNGNFLRQTTLQSISGNQASWATLSGTVVTGANTVYANVALEALDYTNGASALATVWFDNVQCWDVTRTGMTTMPYCELRFPQLPGALLASGVLGDVKAPAIVQMGLFVSSFLAAQTATLWFGRLAQASARLSLVGTSINFGHLLDSTAWGGFTCLANPGALPHRSSDDQGVYHLLARVKTANSSPTGVWLQPDVAYFQEAPGATSIPAFISITSNLLGRYDGTQVYPLTTQNQWTVCDIGQIIIPISGVSALTDLTQVVDYVSSFSGAASGGSQLTANYLAMLPVDGEVAIVRFSSYAGASAFTNQWLWFYLDSMAQVTTWSYETYGIPDIAHSVASYLPGSSALGQAPTATPLSDSIIYVDPNQTTSTGGAGVNEFCLVGTDNNATVLQGAVEVVYSPLYLYPR